MEVLTGVFDMNRISYFRESVSHPLRNFGQQSETVSTPAAMVPALENWGMISARTRSGLVPAGSIWYDSCTLLLFLALFIKTFVFFQGYCDPTSDGYKDKDMDEDCIYTCTEGQCNWTCFSSLFIIDLLFFKLLVFLRISGSKLLCAISFFLLVRLWSMIEYHKWYFLIDGRIPQ